MRHSKPVRLETAPTGRAQVFIYFRKSVATRGWLRHREPRIGIQGNMSTTSNLGDPITFTCQLKYLAFPDHSVYHRIGTERVR